MVRFRNRKQRKKDLNLEGSNDIPLGVILPNAITVCATLSGLFAIKYGLESDFKIAVFLIVLASIFDVLDGRVARMLNVSSKFGAELDSLSDFVCFGVAPAIIVWFWQLNNFSELGWMACSIFVICSSLRLARFNSDLGVKKPSYYYHFFTGIPTPAAAMLLLLPISLNYAFNLTFFNDHLLLSLYTILIGLGMVSNVPTFSSKKLKIPKSMAIFSLLMLIVLIVYAWRNIWQAYSFMMLLYLFSIPYTIVRFVRMRSDYNKELDAIDKIKKD